MSLSSFRIEFDRPGSTYAPGENVTGRVIVYLSREKKVRGLKLCMKGEANVGWSRLRTGRDTHRQSHSDHFVGHERYFDFTYYLIGRSNGAANTTIPLGHNEYSFNYQLPHNIPCSFEYELGHVRYTMKAVLDRPWKFDHECKAAFTVVTPLDLNNHHIQCLGIDEEIGKSFCCMCFIDQGSMKVRIRVPTAGYVPGQSISTTLNISNASEIDTVKVCTKLEKCLKFFARLPRSDTRSVKVIVAETERKGPFIRPDTEITLKLSIPPIPPSYLEYCSIIDLKYRLHITVHVSGMHCNITRTYPILLGTIPLRLLPSAPERPVQPIPLINYMDQPSVSVLTPMPMPSNFVPSPNTPYPPSTSQVNPAIGFNVTNQPSTSTVDWDMPPPSYEECMSRTQNIKDHDESSYVMGADAPFAPRYPVFNDLPPSMTINVNNRNSA